jgi:hypothetical protein
MSKPASLKGAEEPRYAVVKRPRTEDAFLIRASKALFVQVYDHKKAWSLAKYPWLLVEGPFFTLSLSDEHGMGLNIVRMDSGEHFTVIPYGPEGMQCTDREGCGGVVQRGQKLKWKLNSLLQYECDPVRADIMVVEINLSDAANGCLDIENMVRTKFHVAGDFDTTEPCWLSGSITENHCTSWKHHAQEHKKEALQLYAMSNVLQQQIESQRQDMQQERGEALNALLLKHAAEMKAVQDELQLHKTAIEAIKKATTCSYCLKMVPDRGPCMLAECGHFICGGCHNDYFSALGYDEPKCSECRQVVPQNTWQTFYGMTAIVAAVKKTEPREVEHID